MSVCAYCNVRRAVNEDHVIPQSVAKKYKHRPGKCSCKRCFVPLPPQLLGTVPACFECNIRKGARKLVPASWADRIPLLQEYIPGPWRVWDGDPASVAYREVHV